MRREEPIRQPDTPDCARPLQLPPSRLGAVIRQRRRGARSNPCAAVSGRGRRAETTLLSVCGGIPRWQTCVYAPFVLAAASSMPGLFLAAGAVRAQTPCVYERTAGIR